MFDAVSYEDAGVDEYIGIYLHSVNNCFCSVRSETLYYSNNFIFTAREAPKYDWPTRETRVVESIDEQQNGIGVGANNCGHRTPFHERDQSAIVHMTTQSLERVPKKPNLLIQGRGIGVAHG